MKTISDFIDFNELKSYLKFDSIDQDLILIEDISKIPFFDTPVVQSRGVTMICVSGSMEVGIDLERYTITAPALSTIIPGSITQFFNVSNDFKGLTFSASKHFNDKMEINMQQALPVFLYMSENPVTKLTQQELEILKEYYYMLKKAVNMAKCKYQYEIAQHLMHIMFYLVLDIFNKNKESQPRKKSSQELIFEAFIQNVKMHYKVQRELGFYAEKLFITPKHMSAVVKKTSGRSASEWIDKYVILNAQALLKSSKMTIQQISDELNFPNQSFFGSYFKKHIGMSPKEYREK